jgi:hypothetical protein
METVPYVISADLHSAQLFRQTLQNLLSGSGVVGSPDLEVTQETVANMSINIGAGYVFIPGTQGSTTGQRVNAGSQHATYSSLLADFTSQGVYAAVNPAKANLTLEAANATNPRIDLIVASVQDSWYSGSFNQALLQVVTGTPAGSPSPPTPPENTVVLAQVEVKAKATEIKTASITNERPVITAGTVRQETGTAQSFLSWGYVAENGTIEAGTGDFTITKVETGVYRITWTKAKSASYYAVVATPTGIDVTVRLLSTSTTEVELEFEYGGTKASTGFSFSALAAS